MEVEKRGNSTSLLYHPFINATLNAYGSTRASTGPRSETFTGIQKLRLLNNNPSLLETTISEVLMEPNSDLWYRRQKRTIWQEVHFDDPRLLSLFPKSNQREVMALNAGPYLVRKAQGYIPGLLARYKDLFYKNLINSKDIGFIKQD